MIRTRFINALTLLVAGIMIFASCKKVGNNDNPTVAPSANVIVVHAAPVPATYPALDLYSDTGRVTATALAYLGNNQATAITGNLLYFPVLATSSEFNIRPTTTPNVKVGASAVTLGTNENYTFFIYDTLNAATGQFKLLRLTDDLLQPADTSRAKVRFLHLAPNAAAYDVTMVRLSGTTEVDSVTFSNRAYVGLSTPNEAALSAFTTVRGGVYRAKLKLAGTSTVFATINNATATNFLNFAPGKTYTVFITGTAKGQPLALRTIRHF